jgi:hypothetical protein
VIERHEAHVGELTLRPVPRPDDPAGRDGQGGRDIGDAALELRHTEDHPESHTRADDKRRQTKRVRHRGEGKAASSRSAKRLAASSACTTALLGALLLGLTPPGGDLAAQVYRAHLFAQGLTLWDGQWYGGHYLPSYSLVAPALSSVVGPRLLALVAASASSALFALILTTHFGRRAWPAAFAFAVAVLADVVVGRTTFALGQALALGALLALTRGARTPALALAVATAAASPVAAPLLALVVSGSWLVSRRPMKLALAAAAALPVLLIALLFPDGGTQPFHTSSLVGICGLVIAALLVVPRREQALRAGAVLYLVVCVAAYAVPTPLGSNVMRLGMLFGAPLVLATVGPRRAVLAALVALPMLAWQAMPAVTAIARADGDKSLDASYYAPLLGYLGPVADHSSRIEIPTTLNHWEAAYVAPHVALARGWERQLDLRYNALFYGPRLTAARYRHWLDANAVSYVALPDARLDASARAEAQVIRRRPAFLVPVFRSRHWRVFRVRGATPIASGAVALQALYPSRFVLRARRQGRGLVRVHYSPLFVVTGGHACLAPTAGGWTRVLVRRPGQLTVSVVWPPDGAQRCAQARTHR